MNITRPFVALLFTVLMPGYGFCDKYSAKPRSAPGAYTTFNEYRYRSTNPKYIAEPRPSTGGQKTCQAKSVRQPDNTYRQERVCW